MQIADVRHDFGDDFAVGPQHQPQHAVRAGMLRPHVDEHFVRADVEFDDAGIFNGSAHRVSLPSSNAVIFERHFVVFAQRMPDPVFRAEDPPQVRMTVK